TFCAVDASTRNVTRRSERTSGEVTAGGCWLLVAGCWALGAGDWGRACPLELALGSSERRWASEPTSSTASARFLDRTRCGVIFLSVCLRLAQAGRANCNRFHPRLPRGPQAL